MLTDVLRIMANNPFKKKFMGKKNTINVLIAFFIFPKSSVKTFIKWIVNHCLKGIRYHNCALEWICKIITSKVKALNGADVCNYAQFGQAGFWAKDSRQAA